MTIKIINDVPAASVVKRRICGNCGVTLEYTPNDVQKKTETDYTGCKDVYRFIPCPKCSDILYVA